MDLQWKAKVRNEACLLGALTVPIVGVEVTTERGVTDVVLTGARVESGSFARGVP